MERKECVICTSPDITTLVSHPNFPSASVSTVAPRELDRTIEFVVGACIRCGCIQNKILEDPTVLYTNDYTVPNFSSSWKHHHDVFSDFVKDNLKVTRVLEIGGNAGHLIRRHPTLEYSVLDMFRDKSLPDTVNFIQGNCETFDYTGHTTVLMSHVFEHLYRPREFISRLQDGKVQSVFLAIPNFDQEVATSEIHVLNTQHTFFCDLQQIRYIFSAYGYEMKAYHSHACKTIPAHMIQFVYTGCEPTELPSITVAERFVEMHTSYLHHVKKIQTPMIYICPSGMIGQMMWYRLHCNGIKVAGFIDNNLEKDGKRIYGTDLFSIHPSSLKEPANVVLCPSKWRTEICAALSQFPHIHIHGDT